MDPQSLNRALMSSALWFGVSYGVALFAGIDAPVMDIATDAGIMGVSALASDVAHSALGMSATPITSSVGAGVFYAGVQRLYRGDDSLLVNFGLAAANDYAVELVGTSLA